MPPATDTRATLDDLYAVEGKAELIGGRIVHLMGSGDQPSSSPSRSPSVCAIMPSHWPRAGAG